MANPPEQPLLRLGAATAIGRRTGGGIPIPRKFAPGDQAQTPAGRKLTRLSEQLDANTPAFQLRADPDALAPERLLVFELTGGILKFEQAVRLVPGLEFLGAEDLDEDEFDKNPAVYLMVPSEGALSNIVTLWRGWQRDGTVPPRFSAWKTMLSQLRNIRPWGPQDRIASEDVDVLTAEVEAGQPTVRVEIELVFRENAEVAEREARAGIAAVRGVIIARSRIAGAGYHALLTDIPTAALRDALARDPASLAGSEAILQIRPQSVFQSVSLEEVAGFPAGGAPNLAGDPIAAIFDAVPLSQHPRLAGTLSVDETLTSSGIEIPAAGVAAERDKVATILARTPRLVAPETATRRWNLAQAASRSQIDAIEAIYRKQTAEADEENITALTSSASFQRGIGDYKSAVATLTR